MSTFTLPHRTSGVPRVWPGGYWRAALLVAGVAAGISGTLPFRPFWDVRGTHAAPAPAVPLTVAPRVIVPQDPLTEAVRHRAALEAAVGHQCQPASTWPAGQLPTGAVLVSYAAGQRTSATWFPIDQAWPLATSGKWETVLICTR